MKERILIPLVVLVAASLAFSPLCSALPNVTVYGYTDKSYYRPGDTGTLKFWVYNSGTDDLILKNLTILYPWYNPAGLWGGNQTIIPSTSTVISAGQNWNSTASFTVPNDGRAMGGSVTIDVITDKVNRTSYVSLTVTSSPYYFTLQGMDLLNMLVGTMVALMIVLVVIMVLAILVYQHKSRMMWRSEEKPH